ncbi:hypothetical protein [Streptomyces sp. NPDC059863]|uniref:hypothetical protein n=1 Tax=unclassified Streptomyces TaxID=2593676 RepID=UPI003665FB1C
MSVSGCTDEEDFPVPTEGQVVGTWSNPGGERINFNKDGTGLISAGAQLQLSSLIEESETRESCEFSWKVETVPAGGDVWVAVNIRDERCESLDGGKFGLYAYSGESGEVHLSPALEFPEPDEVYSHTTTAP